jgi:hypothetical protein
MAAAVLAAPEAGVRAAGARSDVHERARMVLETFDQEGTPGFVVCA